MLIFLLRSHSNHKLFLKYDSHRFSAYLVYFSCNSAVVFFSNPSQALYSIGENPSERYYIFCYSTTRYVDTAIWWNLIGYEIKSTKFQQKSGATGIFEIYIFPSGSCNAPVHSSSFSTGVPRLMLPGTKLGTKSQHKIWRQWHRWRIIGNIKCYRCRWNFMSLLQ